MASVNRSPSRLFRKYLITLVLLVGGALLVNNLVELYFSYQETKNALADIQREKATSTATTIEQFVDEIKRHILQAATVPRAAGAVGLDERYNDYLRLLQHVPAVTGIAYLDAEGKEQLRVSRLEVNVIGSQDDFSGDKTFQEAKARHLHFSRVYFRNESEPYMTIAAAERGPDAGVVAAQVNLKFIWDVVSQIEVGKAGRAYAVDSTGILVAHLDNTLVLRKTDLSSLPQVQAALAMPLDSSRQQVEVTVARDIQGQRVLTTYKSIEPLGWQVFTEQPLAEAFAPLYSSILRTTLFLVVGLGLAVLTSLFFARKMVTPVQALQAGAARIRAGALDQSINVRTGDELEALGDEFNRMAAQLRESYAKVDSVDSMEGTISVMFTDLESSTELLGSLGDVVAQNLLRTHNEMVREQVASFGGVEVKSMGDGFMLVFSSARRAAECAVAIQCSFHQYNTVHPGSRLNVRIGINVGEAIKEEEDFFGTAVVVAARVASQASGGQIFVSELFRRVVGSAGAFQYIDLGCRQLKGLSGEHRIFEVQWAPVPPDHSE